MSLHFRNVIMSPEYTCTDFRGKILKEYTKALKFGVYNEHSWSIIDEILTEVLTLPSLPCLLASLLTGGITHHEKCTDLGFWRLETLRARRHGTCTTFFLKICYTCKKTWTAPATISTAMLRSPY